MTEKKLAVDGGPFVDYHTSGFTTLQPCLFLTLHTNESG